MININLQAAKSPWNSQTATSETGITFPRLFQGLFFVWRPVMTKEERAVYDKRHYQDNREEIKARTRQYYQNHKEKIKVRHRQYDQDHKVERRKSAKIYQQNHKEEMKKYYQNHKEEMAAQKKQYYQDHREEIKAYFKKYQQTDKGKASRAKSVYKRRTLKLKAEYEDFNKQETLQRDGYICQHCRRKTRPDYKRHHALYPNLDHIIPLTKGGAHTKVNTQCLCHQCNIVKKNTGTGDQLRIF